MTNRTDTYRPNTVLLLDEKEANELIELGWATRINEPAVEVAIANPGSTRALPAKSLEKREEVKKVEPQTVQLVLLRNLYLKVVGLVSGKEYIFNGAGSVVSVLSDDAPALLQKHGGKGCCGSNTEGYYFQLVQ